MTKSPIIYFDNAASAAPYREALEVFAKTAAESFSNPAALHKGGIESEKVITAARETILSELPNGGGLIFTSGATESNNLAIMNSVKPRGKTKIVTTAAEHPSVSNPIDKLAEKGGFDIVRIRPGDISHNTADAAAEQIIGATDGDTALVSVTAACGETGFALDTARIYGEIKGRFPDCVIHTDGVQAFLKVRDINADLISLSAHKTGGLAGVGALYVKDKVRLNPMTFGGGQQKGIRPGTEPTALIAAFAAAVKVGQRDLAPLDVRLTEGLARLNLKVNAGFKKVPGIVNFSCGVKSEIMLHFLAERGIYVSSGSACARGKKSKILPAYGVSDKDTDAAIRVSFGRGNTIAEVDEFLNVLNEGLKRWK